MNSILIDLDNLTATELALLSRMNIGEYNSEKVAMTCVANCGADTTMKLQSAAMTAIEDLES